MPPELIQRANEILAQLEEKHVDEGSPELRKTESPKERLQQAMKEISGPKMQLSIFDAHSETFDDIRKTLSEIDINRLTPVEALMKLNEIKEKLK